MKFWSRSRSASSRSRSHLSGTHLDVDAGGKALEADFRRLPDGEVYSLLIDGGRTRCAVEAGGRSDLRHAPRRSATACVVRHPLEKTLREVRHAGPAATGETIEAPMPGLVVAIQVKVGDTVAAGQAVAVVEAMKMQNELAATTSGIVETIFVSERQTVESGAKLVRLKA